MYPETRPNHLINETSPYLQAHAYNPVDWYPWGEEALEKAKKENKMIFLSIGYHTCHWCHVMEKESFEDDTVAALLNKSFVSIKVDREERPDLDNVYMKACQVMTGSGGWPLNLWLTPDRKPVYAGTYFPKNNHPQRPGLIAVLEQLAVLWQKDPKRVKEQGEQLVLVLNQKSEEKTEADTRFITRQVFKDFKKAYDRQYGGFSKAPKFPTPSQIDYLLAYWKHINEISAKHMAERTLGCMAAGGIHDHLGGGFSRYSVDARWLAPHFEKMLYDNALLLKTYTEAWQLTGKPSHKHVADSICKFLVDELLDEDKGAFYTAYDADSEGKEGTYYLWDKKEVVALLGDEKGEAFCEAYDISEKGNFEGRNILNRIKTYQQEAEWESSLDEEREILEQARRKRIKPNLDDKILMSGNGLAAAALFRYGKASCDSTVVETANRVVDYLMGDGFKPVVLDDVAFLVMALIERHQATQEAQALIDARKLVDAIHEKYWDAEDGGYFLTAIGHEELISRPKEIYDGAMPSGNSVMAMNLLKLSVLLGDVDLYERFQKIKHAFEGDISRAPIYYSAFMEAWLTDEQGADCIVVALAGDEEVTLGPVEGPVAERINQPLTMLVLKPDSILYSQFPSLEGKRSIDGRTTYYACDGFSCKPPTFEW